MDISTRTPTTVRKLEAHTGSIRCLSYDAKKKYASGWMSGVVS